MLDVFASTTGLGSSTPSPPLQVRFIPRQCLCWTSPPSTSYSAATGTPSVNPCRNSMPCTYLIEYFECQNRRSNQSITCNEVSQSLSQQEARKWYPNSNSIVFARRRRMYVPMMEYLRLERKEERMEEEGVYIPPTSPPITHEEVTQGEHASEGSTCVALCFPFRALAVLGGHACMHSSIYPTIDIGQASPCPSFECNWLEGSRFTHLRSRVHQEGIGGPRYVRSYLFSQE